MSEFQKRNKPLKISSRLAAGSLVAVLAACTPQGPDESYVDCRANPEGVATIEIDTRKESEHYLGDAALNDDVLEWREKYTIYGEGGGSFSVSDGSAPYPFSYYEHPPGEAYKVVVSLPAGSFVEATALPEKRGSLPVAISYYCGSQSS